MPKTTTDLLNSIKRRAQLPDDGGTLSDLDILAFATDEIQNVIYPRLMATSEWHYAFYYMETVTSSRTYRLNPRVAGNRIISVEHYDGSNYRFLPLQHPLKQRNDVGESYSVYGNNITLSTAAPTTGTLRIRAVLRPSKLVNTGCTNVTDITNFVITVGSSTGFTGLDKLDVLFYTSPYEARYIDLGFDAILSPTEILVQENITDSPFTTTNQGRLCPAETSDLVQLPDELHDYLAQKVAIRCMEARGFTQDMNNHLRKLADLELAFDRLMSPRVKGEFKAIVDTAWEWDGRYW